MIRGGLRTRLILDSTRVAVIAGLEGLGWFDPTIYDTPPGVRRHQPVQYIPRAERWHNSITPNSLAISSETVSDEPYGLGDEPEDTIVAYADVYAESDPLGWQLAMDIADIVDGRRPDLGRPGPVIDVYDLRGATPAPFTQVDVEDVRVDRAVSPDHSWEAHWFMVRMRLIDEYDDEYGIDRPISDWTDDYAPAWARIQAIEAAL